MQSLKGNLMINIKLMNLMQSLRDVLQQYG